MNFSSYADLQVGHAADLVNRLTPGCRQGRPYTLPEYGVARAELVAEELAEATSTAPTFTPADVEAAIELAGRLRGVFEDAQAGAIGEAASRVNSLLGDFAATPRLTDHGGEPWHLHFSCRGAGAIDAVGATFAVALAVVAASQDLERLGVCTARECDRVYVDVSRNGSRRFCSDRCMNRAKVAAFRARRTGEQNAGDAPDESASSRSQRVGRQPGNHRPGRAGAVVQKMT